MLAKLPRVQLVILIVFLIAVSVMGFATFFKIAEVECRLESEPCSSNLQQSVQQILQHKSFYFTDIETELETDALRTESVVLVAYKKFLPSKILLVLKRESPIYQLQTQDKQFAVYQTGVVREVSATDSVFAITIKQTSDELIENHQLNENIHQALVALSTALTKQNHHIEAITWHSAQEIILDISQGPSVIIDSTNPTTAVAKMDVLLKSHEVQDISEPIREIDLRFKLPVLRT